MILAFGSGGQLSKSFQKIYSKNDILFSSTNDLDLRKSDDIIPYIDKIKPSCIINFSAFNKVDDAEKNDLNALKINHEAVSKMAFYSHSNSIPIVHFSSDYVFDGNQDFPYQENDECNPVNKYGISKFLGERAIIDSNAQFLIIRTSFLYSKTSVSFPQLIKKMIENIDIGGPSMLRSSSKNFKHVTVVPSPKYYNEFMEELNANKGSTSLEFRKKMSAITFSETAYYDSLISNWMSDQNNIKFLDKKTFAGKKIQKLRYGENPHQESSVYEVVNNKKGFYARRLCVPSKSRKRFLK